MAKEHLQHGAGNFSEATSALLIATVTAGCILLCTSCGGSNSGESKIPGPPMSVRNDGLNGVVYFQNCTAARQDKVRLAFGIAYQQVVADPGPLTRCLNDDFLTSVDWSYGEDIAIRMRAPLPTTVICADLPYAADAVGDVPYEELRINNAYVDAASPAQITATVLHEIAHNKGYHHPFELSHDLWHSANESLAFCSESISHGDDPPGPFEGVRRTGLGWGAELGPVGRNGGWPFEVGCNPGTFVSGLNLRTGSFVNAIGLVCRGGGSEYSTSQFGALVGSASTQSCPSGEVAVGAAGRAGQLIDSIGLVCSSEADVLAGLETTSSQFPPAGGLGGFPWARRCPSGMALRTVLVRTSSNVDRLRLICRQLAPTAERRDRRLSGIGEGSGANPYEEIEPCSARTVLTGLWVRSSSEVDRLGGYCSQVAESCQEEGCFQQRIGRSHFLVPHGAWGGVQTDDLCGPDEALIGLQARAGARVDAIGGICASAAEWTRPDRTPTLRFLSLRGGSGGSFTERFCLRSEFVSGWRIRDVDHTPRTVAFVEPICRSFDATWRPRPEGAISMGEDGKLRLLWKTEWGDPKLALWVLSDRLEQEAYRDHGPFPGWLPRSVSVGPDGRTRILWRSTDADPRVSLWMVNSELQQEFYREIDAVPGWTPRVISVGNDGLTRLLWTHWNGSVSIWVFDANLNRIAARDYAPVPGWVARDISVGIDGNTRLLWSHWNGQASVWMLNSNLDLAMNRDYGPFGGWAARHISVGSDLNARLLWTHADGRASLWVLDNGLNVLAAREQGSFAGLTARTISVGPDLKTRVLWTTDEGRISLWIVNERLEQESFREYGPFTGWTPAWPD